MSGGVFDWAGVAALLGVLGAGLKYFVDQWTGRGDKREADLTRRESDYRDKIEKRLASVEERAAAVEEKAAQMERAYTVVLGIVHVWIDEIAHDSPSLPAIAAHLRVAYPVQADMPPDLLNLSGRLDSKKARGGRQ